MAEEECLTHIIHLLGDDVLRIEKLFSEIRHAPARVRRFVERRFKTVEEMEEFLKSNDDDFIVENKRVGVYDEELVSGREKAIEYFKNELLLYNDPPNYFKFRGHIGQAEEEVIGFINCFYPGNEFRNFLSAYPDVFVVHEDDTVYLIENESVDYFEDCLEDFGEEQFYMNLRGHVSQAPLHVRNFINGNFPGKKFLRFLQQNSDVFDVQNGYVYLVPEE